MNRTQNCGLKVVIVRDRAAAGGGIHHYYQAVQKHFTVRHEFVDVGRPHGFYLNKKEGVRCVSTPLRLILDLAALLVKLLRFPDLVHLNPGLDITTLKSLRRDALNICLAKLFLRTVIVFWRGWDNDACGTPEFPCGNRGWLSRVYRMADAHIVLAGDFRDDLRRWGFMAPIHVETTVVADSELGLRGDAIKPEEGRRFRVLFLSRVEVAKGVFEMLDAFALLEAREPGGYQFMIAGDGPGLEQLKERAREVGLKGIEFKGYVEGKVKWACFAEADAFCFLSYTEGMPNAVLEAMAMGLPLVSSAAGGLKDILEDGVSAYLIPYDRSAELGRRFSAEEVACRIERLASEPETRHRMAEHNRRYAREAFGAARVAARLEAIYREVLGLPRIEPTDPVNVVEVGPAAPIYPMPAASEEGGSTGCKPCPTRQQS